MVTACALTRATTESVTKNTQLPQAGSCRTELAQLIHVFFKYLC